MTVQDDPYRPPDGTEISFINNIGVGIQFAAVGGAIYTEARGRGVGRELPTEWFLENVHP